MKKQILTGALALSILVNGGMALASEPGKDKMDIVPISGELINDRSLDLSNIDFYEKDGTKMYPLREVVEDILGMEIKWMEETKSIEIGSGPQWTSISIGKNSYFFARVAHFPLSQAPELKDGKTYVPVEFFTDVMHFDLEETVAPELEEQIITGFIKKNRNNEGQYSLSIIGDGKSSFIDEIILHVSQDTKILDLDGKEIKIQDIEAGAMVEASMMPFMTMSLPPQSTATKIIVKNMDTKIEDKNFEENENIKYPQISGLEKSQEINKEISELIKDIEENEIYEDLEIVYDVNYLSEDKLSIVFYGNFKLDGQEKFLMKSLNFDLKTGKIIDFNNYFKSDEESQEILNKKLAKAVKDQFNIEFEAEGKEIYFKASKVIVFYYPLDDSVIHPLRVEVSIADLDGLIE